MEQKKLKINCAICDISDTAESTLKAYESITINSAVVLTSAKTQALIPQYHVMLNATSVIEKPENAQVKVVNGKCEITAGDTLPQPVALLVNGVLEIGKGTEEILKNYALIQVNGTVVYPDSLSGKLNMLRINGASECYPGDAVLLSRSFVADKAFLLRAKAGKYYAKRRVIMVNEQANPQALCEKGVHFLTRTAILAESLAEKALPLFDEDVEIHLVPDGCAYVSGDVKLDDSLINRYGTKLYIPGDLVLDEDSEPFISQLQYLHVVGSVQLPAKLVAAFCGIKAEYGDLLPVKGLVVRDKVSFGLDMDLLERHPEGITFVSCVNIKLDEQIPPEWIETRLMFKDCVNVTCAAHQRSSVDLVGPNLVQVGPLSAALDDSQDADPDTQVINTAEYQLL